MINIIAIAVAIILTPLILVAKNQGKTYLYLKDHLGSTRVVIERETGNVIETRSYYPYGKQMPGKGVMAGAPATTTEKFTGDHMLNTSWDEIFTLYRVVPLKDNKNSIRVAVGNNYPLNKLEELRFIVGKNIKVAHKDQAWIDQELSQQKTDIKDARE